MLFMSVKICNKLLQMYMYIAYIFPGELVVKLSSAPHSPLII